MKKISASDVGLAIAPGETIRRELEARNIDLDSAADALGLSASDCHRLLDGEIVVDEALADKLANFLGIKAKTWLNLEAMYREGLAAGKPTSYEEPEVSGKFVARIPKSLHVALRDLAAAEGVSLNQVVVAMLAEGIGRASDRLASKAS